jgi:uncharacterized NAD(P)/FAD-binding protein YdhS
MIPYGRKSNSSLSMIHSIAIAIQPDDFVFWLSKQQKPMKFVGVVPSCVYFVTFF